MGEGTLQFKGNNNILFVVVFLWKVEEHYKLRVTTTRSMTDWIPYQVEEHYKLETNDRQS